MIEPFEIRVDDAVLDDLQRRLAATRLPDEIDGTGWEFGIPYGYFGELVTYWRGTYDWRAEEARLNALPQFRTEIDGQPIHFVHARSPRRSAAVASRARVAGSIVEFLDVIAPLTESFHVIAPSLPGYGFSGPTTTRGWDTWRIAPRSRS